MSRRRVQPAKSRPAAPRPAPAASGGSAPRTPWEGWGALLRAAPWGMAALALVLALAVWPLLCKLGWRCVAFADWAGFAEEACRVLPGGAMHWCAAWLGCLWAVPWLGWVVFALLGVGVTALAWRWGRLPAWGAAIPFASVTWAVAYCGVSVWIFVDAAFPWVQLLGWGAALLTVGVARRWGVWGAAAAAALYPVCGTPALMGALLAAAMPGMRVWSRAALALAAVAWPVAWRAFSEADPAWWPLLLADAPFLNEKGASFWNATLALAWGLAALSAWPIRLPRRLARLRPAMWAPAAVFAGMVCFGADPIHPLADILMCERALVRGDLARVLTLSPERAASHRMLAAHTIHALWRAGQLEERLFDYPWKVSHESSTIETMELDGWRLLYSYGIVQMARRWCYEAVVNRGWSPDKLALLARIALVTGERDLARRYARQLARVPFHGKEGDWLLAVADGTAQPDADLRRVAELHARLCVDPGGPTFEGDKRLEPGIYNRYAVLQNGNRDMVCLYLCSSLLRKETTPFHENFDVICRVWPQRPLPRVFQQALLTAASTLPPEQQPRLTADLFTPGMPQAFQDFLRQAPTADPNEGAFVERFRHTYWFYASFVP